MDVGDWTSLVTAGVAVAGTLVATVGLGTGLAQYRKSQQWKRAEFVAGEMKEFNAQPRVKNAMLMLDWTAQQVELFPDHPDPVDRHVWVTHRDLERALIPHTEAPEGKFEEPLASIRLTFDEFFDHLERLGSYVDAGLVTKEELDPYIDYWVHLLGGADQGLLTPRLRDNIWCYIEFYDYGGVKKLLAKYGYDILTDTVKSRVAAARAGS